MSTSPRSNVDPALVTQLKELGIAENSAKYALQRTNNDLHRAADYVFSGAASKDEVRNPSPPGQPSSSSSPAPLPLTSNVTIRSIPSTAPDMSLRRKLSLRKRATVSPKLTQSDSFPTPRPGPPLPPSALPPPSSFTSHPSYNQQATNLILGAIDRSSPLPPVEPPAGSVSRGRTPATPPVDPKRLSVGGVFGGLRIPSGSSTPPKSPAEEAPATSSSGISIIPSKPVGGGSSSSFGPRAPSPFFRARRSRDKKRARERSPDVGALKADPGGESDGESVSAERSGRFRPQASAYEDESEYEGESEPSTAAAITTDEDDDSELGEDEEIYFDEETEKNTEANAYFNENDSGDEVVGERGVLDRFGEEIEQDILGEGPNVVVPEQPVFQTATSVTGTQRQGAQQPKRRKSMRSGQLDMHTTRPSFARDRCTMTITHGDPDGALEQSGKRMRRYVVLSDLSDESRYAVEWAIGTVARDGDEVFVISVKEDEAKVDPKHWGDGDKAQKLRVQKERQVVTLQLVRQITTLLTRTRLNITVTCQFLHAKNARHMLLDLIDFLEPTMTIVGSRGLGQLKGILLGSTSHYLVQKSSVPVMVARRRLQRPLRKIDPSQLRHSPRVSLASAGIEKAASAKQEDDVVDVAETEDSETKESGAAVAK